MRLIISPVSTECIKWKKKRKKARLIRNCSLRTSKESITHQLVECFEYIVFQKKKKKKIDSGHLRHPLLFLPSKLKPIFFNKLFPFLIETRQEGSKSALSLFLVLTHRDGLMRNCFYILATSFWWTESFQLERERELEPTRCSNQNGLE